MRLQAVLTSCFGVAFCILCVALAIANANNAEDFNGAWALIGSHGAGQLPVQISQVWIIQHDRQVYITREFEGRVLKTPAEWEAGGLETKNNGQTTERYTLEPDGSLRLVIERPHAAPATLLFRRQS